MKRLLAFTFALILFQAFSPVYLDDFAAAERKLGTAKRRYFHELVVPKPQLSNHYDGVILGFEKVRNSRLSNKDLTKDDFLAAYHINVENFFIDNSAERLARRNRKLISHKKSNILTTMVKKVNDRQEIEYSIYNKRPQDWKEFNLYRETKVQLDSLDQKIGRQLANKGYTHVIVMSTGWFNTQTHSIERYNQWLDSIGSNARADGYRFKAFYVGITWPSFWSSNGKHFAIDFFNVSSAADRMGIEQINYLLWRSLVPLAKKNNLPVVIIGHSLGARMLTRAAYSAPLFDDIKPEARSVDLMLSLQGAYRYDRHIRAAKKNDGGLYTYFEPFKKYIATSSTHDDALGMAFWTTYMGNSKTMDILKRSDENNIALNSIDSIGFSKPDTVWSRISLYDGSALISSHSDVANPMIGRFMWRMIKNYATRKD